MRTNIWNSVQLNTTILVYRLLSLMGTTLIQLLWLLVRYWTTLLKSYPLHNILLRLFNPSTHPKKFLPNQQFLGLQTCLLVQDLQMQNISFWLGPFSFFLVVKLLTNLMIPTFFFLYQIFSFMPFVFQITSDNISSVVVSDRKYFNKLLATVNQKLNGFWQQNFITKTYVIWQINNYP